MLVLLLPCLHWHQPPTLHFLHLHILSLGPGTDFLTIYLPQWESLIWASKYHVYTTVVIIIQNALGGSMRQQRLGVKSRVPVLAFHWLAVWPWASHVIFLCLSFLISKWGCYLPSRAFVSLMFHALNMTVALEELSIILKVILWWSFHHYESVTKNQMWTFREACCLNHGAISSGILMLHYFTSEASTPVNLSFLT